MIPAFLALVSSLSCHGFSSPVTTRIEILNDMRPIVFKRCSFEGFTTDENGGAICVVLEHTSPSHALLVVGACCFERCSALAGGAVFFAGHQFLLESSIGAACVAREGGALASSRSEKLDVNVTSAVSMSGGSLDLAGGAQIVFSHNTSRSSAGGLVIRKHDSLGLSFAELSAIELGRCLTLQSNVAPEVVTCLTVSDNTVSAILYLAGTYSVRDATFRNNKPEVFVIFGPGGALRLQSCALDVRTVSSTQEDAHIHELVIADASPGVTPRLPPVPLRALLLGSVSDINESDPYNETYTLLVSDPGGSSSTLCQSQAYSLSGIMTATEPGTISEVWNESSRIASSAALHAGVLSTASLYSEIYNLSGGFTLTGPFSATQNVTISESLADTGSIATSLTLNSLAPESNFYLPSDNITMSAQGNISNPGTISEVLNQSSWIAFSAALHTGLLSTASLYSEIYNLSGGFTGSETGTVTDSLYLSGGINSSLTFNTEAQAHSTTYKSSEVFLVSEGQLTGSVNTSAHITSSLTVVCTAEQSRTSAYSLSRNFSFSEDRISSLLNDSSEIATGAMPYTTDLLSSGNYRLSETVTATAPGALTNPNGASNEIAASVKLGTAVLESHWLFGSEDYPLSNNFTFSAIGNGTNWFHASSEVGASPRLETPVLKSQALRSSENYISSDEFTVSMTSTGTQNITISEGIAPSSSLPTTFLYSLPLLGSNNYTLSGSLTISGVGYTKSDVFTLSGTPLQSGPVNASQSPESEVLILSSSLLVSGNLAWSPSYAKSQQGTASGFINVSEPVEFLVTGNLTLSQLASTGIIENSEQLDTVGGSWRSANAMFSIPITQSNSVLISQTLNESRIVTTQDLADSNNAPGSDNLRWSNRLTLSANYAFSGRVTFSACGSASGEGNFSDAFSVSKLDTSSELVPSAQQFSLRLHDTKTLVLSDWCNDSLDFTISLNRNPTANFKFSEELRFSRLLSSDTLLTGFYRESANGALSNRLTLSGRALASDFDNVSGEYFNSRGLNGTWVVATDGYSSSADLSFSNRYPLSNNYTRSGVAAFSVRLDASSSVITRVLLVSDQRSQSDSYDLSDGLVPSALVTYSRAALSGGFEFSTDWMVTHNLKYSELRSVSGPDLSDHFSLSVEPSESAALRRSSSELLSMPYTTSGGLTSSIGMSRSGAETNSVALSPSGRPIVSQVLVVTQSYTRSGQGTYSVPLHLSSGLSKIGGRAFSAHFLGSVTLAESTLGTASRNVTLSDVLLLSVVLNATGEDWGSESKGFQGTIVQGLSGVFAESLTLLPLVPPTPEGQWSNSSILLLAILGSLLFLILLAALLWLFLAGRRETTYSSPTSVAEGPSLSDEEESAEGDVEGVVTFDAQPGASVPDSLVPLPSSPVLGPSGSDSQSSSYSDAPVLLPPAPAPPLPIPQPDSEYSSSYYSDATPAKAAAEPSSSDSYSSNELERPVPPAVKPPPPPAVESVSSDSDSEPPKGPTPTTPLTPAPSAPPRDKYDYSYSDSEPAAAAQPTGPPAEDSDS